MFTVLGMPTLPDEEMATDRRKTRMRYIDEPVNELCFRFKYHNHGKSFLRNVVSFATYLLPLESRSVDSVPRSLVSEPFGYDSVLVH